MFLNHYRLITIFFKRYFHIDYLYLRNLSKNTFLFLFIIFISCGSGTTVPLTPDTIEKTAVTDSLLTTNEEVELQKPIITGANQTENYIPLLIGKKVGIVGNQTSVIFKSLHTKSIQEKEEKYNSRNYTHLVDSLLLRGIQIQKVFGPEHGFRGKADASETISDGKDAKTNLPIISLYGKQKKPSKESMANLDIMLFDIQDVGVRFYTYISTLHYVMQACAENKIPLLILDRPNPNGHYVDGPILEKEHASFIGMHPVPVVHGMTIGEYAQMINGQGWLGNNLKCNISIIPVQNYTHATPYSLPIRPSPNLPNDQAISLYPSLGFLEGTSINAGRGTEMQFQIFGSPHLPIEKYDFAYTPKPNFGAKNPKHSKTVCYGRDLKNKEVENRIDLQYLIDAYRNFEDKEKFFNSPSFTIHAGTKKLEQQIKQRYTYREIKKTWYRDLEAYKKVRAEYLIYE